MEARAEEKTVGPELLPPPPPPPPPSSPLVVLFAQEPLTPSVLPTGVGGVGVPGRGQRPFRIPGERARSEEPSWGDVTAIPKMAGWHTEDGEQDLPLCALKEPACARGHPGPNSTKYCLQKVSTEIISHLNEESSPVWQRTRRKKRATVQAGNVPVIHVHDIVLMCVIHIHYF